MMIDKSAYQDYETARLNRDSNYDGQFYFAVSTTGIFCRPSCPSPKAKSENVAYYSSVMEAMNHGYRPCLRCRPDIHTDYYNSYKDGYKQVEDALQLIYEGYLSNHSVADLANTLYTSERSLRQHFKDHLNMSPMAVAKYHKGLFARQLLLNTDMSITDLAMSAGYRSIRQFNDMFKELFHQPPRDLRKSGQSSQISDAKGLLITVPQDFNFSKATAFMRPRSLIGVEVFTEDSYSRTFTYQETPGHFKVTYCPNLSAIRLTVDCADVRSLMPIYHRVRTMFDLNTDLNKVTAHLKKDPLLKKGMIDGRVPSIPVAFDPFEFVIRAILGQVVSVSFATTLAIRLTERAGCHTPEHFPEGLDYFFPEPAQLATVDLTDMGMTKSKTSTIHNVIDALLEDRLQLHWHQSLESFAKDFAALKGIGDWTVHYVAMRGLGMKDAFPYNDLGVIKALSTPGHKAKAKEIKEIGKAWAPYRSYGTMCLWNLPSDLKNKE